MAMEEGFEKLDLSGKLIIKATVGHDIRRIPIHNDDLTYDELVLMMQRVFKSVISPDDDLRLKYKDEDGDLVTITDSADLSYAIQYCRVLKLSVIVNPEAARNAYPEASTNIHPNVIKELVNIRDRVIHLLDTIHKDTKLKPNSSDMDCLENLESSREQVTQDNLPKMTTEGREFDPLTESSDQHNADQPSDANTIQGHVSANHEPPTPTTNPSLFSGPTAFPQQPTEYQSFSQPDHKNPETPQPSAAQTSNQMIAQSQAYQPASSTQHSYPTQTPTSYQPTLQPNYAHETPQANYPSQTPSVPQPTYTPSTAQTPSVPRPSYIPSQQNFPAYNGSSIYPTQSAPVAPPGDGPKPPSGPPASTYPGPTTSSTYQGPPTSSATFPGSINTSATYPGAPTTSSTYPGSSTSSYPGVGQAYPGAIPAVAPTYPRVSGGFPTSAPAAGNPYSCGRQPRYSHPTSQSYN